MSAYVCEDKTIQRIIGYLHTAATGNQMHQGRVRGEIDIHSDVTGGADALATKAGLKALGDKIRATNHQAVCERYEEITPVEPFDFKFVLATTPMQCYDALRCMIYQCSEGSVPGKSPVFHFLEDVFDALAHQIVDTAARRGLLAS